MNYTPLEKLLFESGLKVNEFADKVEVNRLTFKSQLYYQKESHEFYAIKYSRILKQNFEYKSKGLLIQLEF